MTFGFPRLSINRQAYTPPVTLLAAGVVAVLAGIMFHHTWVDFPTRHAAALVVISALAWGMSRVLQRFFKIPMASGLAVIFALALVWMVGSRPVLATILMTVAAAGLGARLVPSATPARWAVAVIAGLALMAGGLGWVVSVRGHGPWLYGSALLLLVLVSRRELRQLGDGLLSRWSGTVCAEPRMAALGVMSLGLVSVVLWLPDLGYDDLAYHLALPVQLSVLGHYRLDPATQIWALAPWAGDIIQAIGYVLSGESARGAVNALWLILSGTLLWRLGREFGLDAGRAWLTLTLYASMPLTALLALGLQTEAPSIAVLLALALVIQRAPPRPDASVLQLVAVLMGCLLALKLSNALSAAPMGLWLLARWRGRLPWRAVPASLALLLLIGGSSYFHAWVLAGNPVLPLYNDVFQSQFMWPERFLDHRWSAPLDWALPWRLTFDTSMYLESWPGAAGFLLVGLLGVLPLALVRSRPGAPLRPLILVGMSVFLLPLLFVHYLRYAQPGLVLMLPALMAGLEEAQPRRWADRLLVALVVLNLVFHGNVHWTLHYGALPKQIVQGRIAVLERFAAEVRVAEWLRYKSLDETRILLADRDRAYTAPFAGRAFGSNWYDLEIRTLAVVADQDTTGEAWRQAWFDLGMTHILTITPIAPPIEAALTLTGATVVYAFGEAQLWQLPQSGTRDLVRERDLARQGLLRRWMFQ